MLLQNVWYKIRKFIQKCTLGIILLRENDETFVFSLLFQKHDFWLEILQSPKLSFWRSFTKSQIFLFRNFTRPHGLKYNLYNVSDFELWNSKHFRSWKECIRKTPFSVFLHPKTTFFRFFVFLLKAWFGFRNLTAWIFEKIIIKGFILWKKRSKRFRV